ncbi:phosphoglycerate mutase-like protein 1 [Hibiscus syriacus]|uniref:phosphoglycerate mutase-like protein 1 n=1 Tax=Hibiscus syriacus TaxID=106335 RepID=UPI0019242690|nr:phosphoglycerate mutase-like protein 1 [Hibiscus syriacus]
MEGIAAAQFGRRKLIHLVRHAQGKHNLEADKSRDPLTSFEYLDAELSPLGWQQVRDQRKDVCSSGLLKGIEVVISSPMSRTLQTAVGIFHGEDDEDSTTVHLPPIIAYELCRERLGKFECDKRRSISHYQSRFPAVDFSLIENEDDILWKGGDQIETHEAVRARAMKFTQWLWEREEKEIAVVSHGVYLQQAMIELIKNNLCYPLHNDPLSRFKNCEIRSVFIFSERITGAGSDAFVMKNTNRGRMRIPCEIEQLQIKDSAKENVSVEELEVTN